MGEAADRWASVPLLRKDLKIKFISEEMSTHQNCKAYLTAYRVERGASLANLSSIFWIQEKQTSGKPPAIYRPWAFA